MLKRWSHRPAVIPALAASLCLGAACARQMTSSPLGGPLPEIATDSSQFAAVVTSLMVDPAWSGFRVRAFPLPRHPEVSTILLKSTSPGAGKVARVRERVLASLGVPIQKKIKATDCQTWFIVGDNPGTCPASARVEVAIGLAREGGAYYPVNSIDERAIASEFPRQTMRVIVRRTGPTGTEGWKYDYVLEYRGGRWQVAKRVILPGVDN